MSKKFICVTDWINLDKIVNNDIWGVKEHHRRQIYNTSIGDKLLFYIKAGKDGGRKKDTAIFGIYEVASDVFYDDSQIFKGKEAFPLRVEIKRTVHIEGPKDFRSLISKLRVIKNKEKWGLLFWGRAMIEVDEHDFNLIAEYLE